MIFATHNMRIFYVSIIAFILPIISIDAQPGAYGTDLYASFKGEKGQLITFDNKEFDIKWVSSKPVLVTPYKWGMVADTLSFAVDNRSEIRQNGMERAYVKNDSIYLIDVRKTPAGGDIKEGSHFLIVKNNADTMRLYPPVGCKYLYNIQFRTGNYKIPYLTYFFHATLKEDKRKFFKPNLIDDWDLFRIENKEPKRKIIYAEVIPDNELAMVSQIYTNDSAIDNSEYFKAEFFIDPSEFEDIDPWAGLNNLFCLEKKNKTDNSPAFFAIFRSGLFIYKENENSLYQYGFIEVPIDTTGVSKYKEKNDLAERKDDIYWGVHEIIRAGDLLQLSNVKGLQTSNDMQEVYIAGSYNFYTLKRGIYESYSGLFKPYFGFLPDEEIKRIARKHTKLNGMMREDKKRMRTN